MPTIAETARAKINLALAVTGQRSDGYHLIDTIAVFADAGDRLEVEAADDLVLEATGPFAADLPEPPANLIHKAAIALANAAFASDSPGARMRLDKRLPVASGIGAGSADAAAALRGLTRLWKLDWSRKRLAALGLSLGADLPMCLESRPLRACGIGEHVEPLGRFPTLHLVLVNPGVQVPTARVFGEFAGRFSAPLPEPADIADLEKALVYLAATGNDLEAPAMGVAPVIGDVLAALRAQAGCRLARMSGSGATCFGVFANPAAAAVAARQLSAVRPHWWMIATATAGTRPAIQGV